MVKGEPPSRGCSNSPLFFIGRNGCGNWVVQDEEGLYGGLFVNGAVALKFAFFKPRVSDYAASNTHASLERAA